MVDNQQNTTIVAPHSNSRVSGTITVEVEVVACNCTVTTALSVDSVFVSNGTRQSMVKHDDIWYEVFTHQWDTRTVYDGMHQLKVLGKHTRYSDTISIAVDNEESGGNDVPGFLFGLMIGALGIALLLYEGTKPS